MGAIDPGAYEEWYRQIAEANAPAATPGPTTPVPGHPGGFLRPLRPDDGQPLKVGVNVADASQATLTKRSLYMTSVLPSPRFLSTPCEQDAIAGRWRPDVHCVTTGVTGHCNGLGTHLRVQRTTLYDSVVLPAGFQALYHCLFTAASGKTNREIHPGITTGGQLSAPRAFEVHRIRCWFGRDPGASLDPHLLRQDVDAARNALQGELRVGHVNVWTGPLATLPFRFDARPILLPPLQAFLFGLERGAQLAWDLRVWIGLEGYFGLELA